MFSVYNSLCMLMEAWVKWQHCQGNRTLLLTHVRLTGDVIPVTLALFTYGHSYRCLLSLITNQVNTGVRNTKDRVSGLQIKLHSTLSAHFVVWTRLKLSRILWHILLKMKSVPVRWGVVCKRITWKSKEMWNKTAYISRSERKDGI